MQRREFIRKTLALTAAGWTSLHLSGCAGSKPDRLPQRPNILFLYTDDQSFSTINSWNNSAIHTPNLNRLYRQGTTFTNAYNMGGWNGAICIASRAMLNTCRPLWCCGYDSMRDKSGKTYPLFAQQFRQAGYKTFGVGKWHNGSEAAELSFTHNNVAHMGMYHSTDMNGDAYWRDGSEDETWLPDDINRKGHWLDTKDKDGQPAKIHTSDLWAEKSIDFLHNVAAHSEDPFMMYVSFHAPHDPRQAPTKYVQMYPRDEIVIPENFQPEHILAIGDKYVRDEILAPIPRNEDSVRVNLQEYYAIISHMDDCIGKILASLNQIGKDKETIIVFTSDHGLAVGQHGLMGKQNLYDHSVRVPLIFAGPGIAGNRQISKQVYYQSLASTLLEMCNIAIPETFEFSSLWPMLQGGKDGFQGQQEIYLAYNIFQRAIRTDRYKLIYYPYANSEIKWNDNVQVPLKPYKPALQLFDVVKDPLEMNNLADDENYAGLLLDLTDRLQKLMDKHQDRQNLARPVDCTNYGSLHRKGVSTDK